MQFARFIFGVIGTTCKYLLLATGLIALTSCKFFSMDYVPTGEQITRWFPLLLVEPKNIKGIYGNYDVDSIIFSYETAAKKPLDAIRAALKNEGWREFHSANSEVSFERYRLPPPRGMQFHSLEITQALHTGHKVCVVYLQLDSMTGTFDRANDTESRWASERLFPKYEACKQT